MTKYNRHIAQLLCLIFVLLGVEKINFFTPQDCETRQSFCPTANRYVYHFDSSTAVDGVNQTNKPKNCKVTNISCETFFIAQDLDHSATKDCPLFDRELYFYQPVIHSNPYITLVDPPPMV